MLWTQRIDIHPACRRADFGRVGDYRHTDICRMYYFSLLLFFGLLYLYIWVISSKKVKLYGEKGTSGYTKLRLNSQGTGFITLPKIFQTQANPNLPSNRSLELFLLWLAPQA